MFVSLCSAWLCFALLFLALLYFCSVLCFGTGALHMSPVTFWAPVGVIVGFIFEAEALWVPGRPPRRTKKKKCVPGSSQDPPFWITFGGTFWLTFASFCLALWPKWHQIGAKVVQGGAKKSPSGATSLPNSFQEGPKQCQK